MTVHSLTTTCNKTRLLGLYVLIEDEFRHYLTILGITSRYGYFFLTCFINIFFSQQAETAHLEHLSWSWDQVNWNFATRQNQTRR